MPILHTQCPHKRKRKPKLSSLDMLVLNLVFVAVFATSGAHSGISEYIQGQWVLTDEKLQYGDPDEETLAAEEGLWFDSPPEMFEVETVDDYDFVATSPQSYVIKEQDHEGESAAWKIALVAAVLLVSAVGSLSVAYYLCVWRGGRIHYQPQKGGCASI